MLTNFKIVKEYIILLLYFRQCASWSRTWIFYFSSLISRGFIRWRKHSKVIRSIKSCPNYIIIWSMFLLLIIISSVYFVHWNIKFYDIIFSCLAIHDGDLKSTLNKWSKQQYYFVHTYIIFRTSRWSWIWIFYFYLTFSLSIRPKKYQKFSQITEHAWTTSTSEQCFFCLLLLVTCIYAIGILTALVLLCFHMWMDI